MTWLTILRKNKSHHTQCEAGGLVKIQKIRYDSILMATNVEITKNQNESNTNLIRRFSKQVRESGILNRVRGTRFFERKPSQFVKKSQALKRIKKTAEIEKLKKLGKL
jgi:ribosomal protein S21